ncbi:MAG TPA: phosphatase PAP2 family protein [Ignavibacteria bacterium]|nr:phosphatase PAP2 family protein [Ignavibacteria bacterium]HMQ97771.1 phosphatase PAP2 family protein [Ignavibacteria bacterium]
MKKIIVIAVSMLAFLFSNTYSDSTITKSQLKPPKTTVIQDLGSDLKYFALDWGAFFAAPFSSSKNMIWSSSVVAGTVLSSAVDKDFRKQFSVPGSSQYSGTFLDGPIAYGYVQYPSILGGAMYTIGLLARESELRKTGRMLIQSLVYSGTVTMALRYATGRHRPFSSSGNQYEFSWFNSAGDTQSFPSGHTVVAFATSTILAEQIDTWWARAVLYSFAALTGYARLHYDKHWFSDVFFGAALGFGSSMFVLHREREREKENKRKMKKGGGFSFSPAVNGINFSYGF